MFYVGFLRGCLSFVRNPCENKSMGKNPKRRDFTMIFLAWGCFLRSGE